MGDRSQSPENDGYGRFGDAAGLNKGTQVLSTQY